MSSYRGDEWLLHFRCWITGDEHPKAHAAIFCAGIGVSQPLSWSDDDATISSHAIEKYVTVTWNALDKHLKYIVYDWQAGVVVLVSLFL